MPLPPLSWQQIYEGSKRLLQSVSCSTEVSLVHSYKSFSVCFVFFFLALIFSIVQVIQTTFQFLEGKSGKAIFNQVIINTGSSSQVSQCTQQLAELKICLNLEHVVQCCRQGCIQVMCLDSKHCLYVRNAQFPFLQHEPRSAKTILLKAVFRESKNMNHVLLISRLTSQPLNCFPPK